MEWHYLDTTGTQQGPVSEAQLKQAWATGLLDGESLVWNESMDNWQQVSTLPHVLKMVQPPQPVQPAKPAPGRGPPPGRSGPSAGRPSPAIATAGPSGPGERKSVHKQHAQHQHAVQLQRHPNEPEHAPKTNWKEFITPEGVKYYHNAATGQTTWDKPDELKSPDEMDRKGEWYWLPVDTEKAFVPARKTQTFHDGRWELQTEDGSTNLVKKKDAESLEPLQWSHLRRLEKDLVMLDVMNRPLIIHNLRERFGQNEIYTNVGTILISCNPYKLLPLYTPQVIDQYRHRGTRQLAPHVFTIADDAYNYLTDHLRGQSIVISGESGAGKTECTKQCLQYLAEVAGSDNNVEQKILVANPILEAFGNAKTVRNNNSSRFGKYVEIFFDGRGMISGARTTNYLLEKSRVVLQNEGERNFHVFYELCLGCSPQQKQKYFLQDPKSFHYLNQGTVQIDGQNDAEEFKELESALKLLEFKDAECQAIFQIVSGLLHLGNVTFKDSGERKCQAEGKDALSHASQLLEMTSSDLTAALTSKILRMKGQADITVTLSADEAGQARDTLSKFVYEHLFDWLVQRINKSIGEGKGATLERSIGILDIFGFEIFRKNSFEQLCINFANEKLQQYFNQHTFKLEESVYKSEAIKFVHVEYIDNQGVLDLIEKYPRGVLGMIDEELRIPRGTDQTFVRKLQETHKATPEFDRVLANPDDFVIKHYAGAVHYESTGFLEKNKDRLNDDIFNLLQNTKLGFLKALFPKEADAEHKYTLGKKFSGQLNALMDTLNKTEPHYIRCIKPNPNKAQLQFHGNMVLEQLQYSGVFEAVQIRKSGYPFRYTHEMFFKRFKCIVKGKRWGNNYKQNCVELIKEMKQSFDEVQVGQTMVLYRSTNHRDMELIRNVAVERTVILIQKWVRRFLAQNLLKKMKAIKPKLAQLLMQCQKSRSIPDIDKAIELAAQISTFFVMYEVEQLKWLKHVIVEEERITKLLADLLRGDHEKNFEALSRAVASANEIELRSAEAEKAREVVAFIKEKRAVAAALKAGVEEYDEDKLRHNLERAQELGVQENVDKAYEMLEALIKEKQWLYDNAVYQLQVLEEEVMQDILSRADGIRYTTPEIDRIRELLLDTPEEKFVQLQLKAAVANNDPARAIRVTIRLKDLFFAKAGDMFTFQNFGALRDRMEWANMKFLSFNKEELAATMHYHTTQPIHASLMVLPTPLNKLAKTVFKNIMGWMGDRQYNDPVGLVKEMMNTCLLNPGVRDEVYCQLIKQLTRNPSSESVRKGWQLMAICLETFPPNKEFENFLEMYLRTNANPKERYIQLLHQSVYSGPLTYCPSEQDIQKIANGGNSRQMNVEIRPEEKAAAREALAFGGYGPQGAAMGPSAPRPQMGAVSPRGHPGGSASPPPGGPPRGPPPGGPPPGGPPRGAPPGGPPPGGPPRGPPPGGPPAGPPPGGPPPGAPPGGPPRGPPPGGPPRGPPPGGPPPGMRSASPPPGAPPAGPPPGAPPAGPPPGAPYGAPAPARRQLPGGLLSRPPMGPPAGAPPAGPPPGAPPSGPPPGAPPSGPPPGAPGRGPPPGGMAMPGMGMAPGAGRAGLRAAPAAAPRNNGPARPQMPSRMAMPPRGGPPAGPPPKKSAWQVVKHPDTGEEYYHNTETNETSWDKPPGM